MGKNKETKLSIAEPNIKRAQFYIRGTAPLVMNKFSSKAKQQMKETQEAGSTAKKGKKREAKDFKECYENAKHVSTQGWLGIPAAAFRCAIIGACRTVGFAMTRAKLAVFIEADGFDADDATPLVKILKGKPRQLESTVRLANQSCDIHVRPMWDAGWEAKLTIAFDADQFTLEDVTNLLMRVGVQVGILEGRPGSPNSCGMGWGLFELIKPKK